MSGPGHNSGAALERINGYLDRVERLTQERKIINEDIREIMAEAKASGLDVAQLRHLLKLREMDKEKREDFIATRNIYEDSVFG